MRHFWHHQEKSADWDRISFHGLNEEDQWPFQAGYPNVTSKGGHVFFGYSEGTGRARILEGSGTPIRFGLLFINQEGKLQRCGASAMVSDLLDPYGCPAWVDCLSMQIICYNQVAAWCAPPKG